MRSYHAIVMVDLVKKVELHDCVLASKFYGKVYDMKIQQVYLPQPIPIQSLWLSYLKVSS